MTYIDMNLIKNECKFAEKHEVFMAVTFHIVIWVLTPRGFVSWYQCYR
jgi:hypothetical protein